MARNRVVTISIIYTVTTKELPHGHPGVAPAAIQQGKHLAGNIALMLKGKNLVPFEYKEKGSLATIGRNQAVADFGKIHLRGFFAWLLWGLIHILSIAGFTNKGIIFFNWMVNYINANSDNRLIIRTYNNETKIVDAENSGK